MEKYISKEQALMQLTGEFPKDMSLEKYIGLITCRINELATTDVIPIPKEATNGGMIKAMFPQVVVTSEERATIHFYVDDEDGHTLFTGCMPQYVWNAPFQKEVEE